MIQRLAQVSEAEIASISDADLRIMLRGVRKGAQVDEVEEAFRVLYEDFLPVRLGGDAIYSTLSSTLASAAAAGDPAVRKLVAAGAATADQVERMRGIFAAADADGSGALDREEARRFLTALRDGAAGGTAAGGAAAPARGGIGIAGDLTALRAGLGQPAGGGGGGAAAAAAGDGEVAAFLARADADGDGRICFAEFAAGAADLMALPPPEQDAILDRLVRYWAAAGRPAAAAAGGGAAGSKESRRFDHYLETFRRWELAGKGPPAAAAATTTTTTNGGGSAIGGGGGGGGGGGRLEVVLRGCMVGARTPEVVEALRLVYTKYPPLRMAGDLIFQLMERLVGA